MKQGLLKVNVVEAYMQEDYDKKNCSCFILLETRAQRLRTQLTASGESGRWRTWANEVAELNLTRENHTDMRVLLCVQSTSEAEPEIIGTALIVLQPFVS